MSAYATQADIEANLKGIVFNTSTAITALQLADYITQESATIDFYINQKYNLPIVSADALSFLEKICIALVVFRVKNTLQPKTALPQPDDKASQDIVGASQYRDAMSMLKAIKNGEASLPGEDPKGKVLFSSTAVNNDTQTVFEVEEQQW